MWFKQWARWFKPILNSSPLTLPSLNFEKKVILLTKSKKIKTLNKFKKIKEKFFVFNLIKNITLLNKLMFF